MTIAKQYTMILLAMSLAFALGWTSRGDRIYGGMFAGSVKMMEQLK